MVSLRNMQHMLHVT